ncbi:MAG: histidine kinase dimerization/phospho-acceptor domain-containing protein [Lacunisphaera sp.]
MLTPEYRIVAAERCLPGRHDDAARGRSWAGGCSRCFPTIPATRRRMACAICGLRWSGVRERVGPDTMAIQKYDVRRPDGSFEERYWSPINSPLAGPDGRLLYIIHRVEDVTDFVRRQKPAGAGEGRPADAPAEMEAEVFQSSQKVQAVNQQLEVANKELEAFSYSVSHDLRAPLRHIQGYVEMLARERRRTGCRKRRTATCAPSPRPAARWARLIDDLLAFSRMGRSEMVEQEVDLAALVAGDAARPGAGDRRPAGPVENRCRCPGCGATRRCCGRCWRISWATPSNTRAAASRPRS